MLLAIDTAWRVNLKNDIQGGGKRELSDTIRTKCDQTLISKTPPPLAVSTHDTLCGSYFKIAYTTLFSLNFGAKVKKIYYVGFVLQFNVKRLSKGPLLHYVSKEGRWGAGGGKRVVSDTIVTNCD